MKITYTDLTQLVSLAIKINVSLKLNIFNSGTAIFNMKTLNPVATSKIYSNSSLICVMKIASSHKTISLALSVRHILIVHFGVYFKVYLIPFQVLKCVGLTVHQRTFLGYTTRQERRMNNCLNLQEARWMSHHPPAIRWLDKGLQNLAPCFTKV